MQIRMNDPSAMKITARRIGEDRNPLVVVDNFLANADEVRKIALASQYQASHEYPGFIAPNAMVGLKSVVQWVARYFADEFYGGLPMFKHRGEATGRSRLSIFAPAGDKKLSSIHYDPNNFIGAVVYLSENEGSGTGFWRDKVTQLESYFDTNVLALQKIEAVFGVRVMDKLQRAFLKTPVMRAADVEKMLFDDRALEPGQYPARSFGDWELIDHVPMKFNRLVFYPGWQLHSVTWEGYKPSASMDESRLTMNISIPWPFAKEGKSMAGPPLPGMECLKTYTYN